MYEAHFGLREKPFSLIPDPDSLYLSKEHQQAFTMLEYGLLEQAGVTVITGEIGAGKTSLLRYLLKRLDQNTLVVGLINNTHSSFGSLLQLVAHSFDLEISSKEQIELFSAIEKFLIEQYSQGKRCVLVVDEAQNLDAYALESLRLISNINADKHQLLQIVLIGQPELREQLSDPKLLQIAQRVSAEYHLPPLTAEEAINYIAHRLKVAGAKYPIFDIAASGAIYYCSGGIPRLINILCDYALVYAYGEGKPRVDLSVVLEIVKDKKIVGLARKELNNEDYREMIDICRSMLKVKRVTTLRESAKSTSQEDAPKP